VRSAPHRRFTVTLPTRISKPAVNVSEPGLFPFGGPGSSFPRSSLCRFTVIPPAEGAPTVRHAEPRKLPPLPCPDCGHPRPHHDPSAWDAGFPTLPCSDCPGGVCGVNPEPLPAAVSRLASRLLLV